MNASNQEVSAAQIIESLSMVYGLKSLPRAGWIQSGVPGDDVESVASHSYGMSVIILYLSHVLEEKGIDVDRCLRMALVHDMAEALTGDKTPEDGISPVEKYTQESNALDKILKDLANPEEFRGLWEEFEAGETPEAQLVRRVDKLDMMIQAFLYEKTFNIRLDSFWKGIDSLFQDTESESIFNYLSNNRFEVESLE